MLMMLPPCLVKCVQSLGQLALQHLESKGAMRLEIYPADAHDALLLSRQMHTINTITGAVGLRGLCGQKYTQLMLMMLSSCLVKCTQTLGQLAVQHLESKGAMWPEICPADAHDVPLLPRQMHTITGAVGFATSGVKGGHVAGNIPN